MPADAPRIPVVPAGIRGCFAGVTPLPDAELAEHEALALWASDRARLAKSSRCGVRLIRWADRLAAEWR